jgi:hypothetical protein
VVPGLVFNLDHRSDTDLVGRELRRVDEYRVVEA